MVVIVYLLVVSSGVCGSYSCGRACDMVCGSEANSKHGVEERNERSPAKGSPFKPQGRLKTSSLLIL